MAGRQDPALTTPQPQGRDQAVQRFTSMPASLADYPTYRLGVGDVIEVTYDVEATPLGSGNGYRLQRGDALRIRFPYDTQYDQRVTVHRDGKIRALLLGAVPAAGLTIEQLHGQLRAGYARYIRDPELTLDVERANARVAQLNKAVTAGRPGRPRLLPIKPDGTIDLPLTGEVSAAGKTVAELSGDLKQRYSQAGLDHLDVRVQVVAFAPRRVYVLGQVHWPRMITLQAPISAVQAIATAGGMTPRADLQRVTVIRRHGLAVPEATVVNVGGMLEAVASSGPGGRPDGSAFRYDVWLADGDIVYVAAKGEKATPSLPGETFFRSAGHDESGRPGK